MKVVRVGELPTKLLGQETSDGRLPGADYSHHNHDHVEVFCVAQPSLRRGAGATTRLLLRISLLRAGARVRDGERAVGFRRDFDVLALAIFFGVRDALLGDVVIFV